MPTTLLVSLRKIMTMEKLLFCQRRQPTARTDLVLGQYSKFSCAVKKYGLPIDVDLSATFSSESRNEFHALVHLWFGDKGTICSPEGTSACSSSFGAKMVNASFNSFAGNSNNHRSVSKHVSESLCVCATITP